MKYIKCLKLPFSIFILFFLINKFSLTEANIKTLHFNYALMILSLIVFWSSEMVSALRCVYIAKKLGKRLRCSEAVKALFLGMLFNQVLPSSIGGDVVKIGVLKPSLGLKDALVTSVLSRFGGLFIMMFLFLALYPIYIIYFSDTGYDLIFLITVVALLFVIFTCVFVLISEELKIRNNNGWIQKLTNSTFEYLSYYKSARFTWNQTWTSILVHFGGVLSYVILSAAIGLDIKPILVVLVVPIVFLGALIPVSFAGWGVREAMSVWVFGLVNVDADKALILSMAYGFFLLVAALPGLYYMFFKNEKYSNV